MNNEIKISPSQIAKAINDLLDENEKLKKQEKVSYELSKDYFNRIQKAIEYIKHCPEYLWNNVNTKVLLNILNNRSDE